MANYLILCAGFGSRLRPLTKTTPKPLIQLGSTSILERLMSQISLVDPKSYFYINLHYEITKFPSALRHMVSNRNIRVIWEPTLLGSANTLDEAFSFSKESFWVLHGDLLLAQNGLSSLLDFQSQHLGSSILVSHSRRASDARSVIEVEENRVTQFTQGSPQTSEFTNREILSNSGVYYFYKDDLTKFSQQYKIPATIEECLIPQIVQYSQLLNFHWKFPRVSIENYQMLELARNISKDIP